MVKEGSDYFLLRRFPTETSWNLMHVTSTPSIPLYIGLSNKTWGEPFEMRTNFDYLKIEERIDSSEDKFVRLFD